MGEDTYPTGPENGVYTYGLYLEGARWDKGQGALAESLPKALFAHAPTMLWVPYRKANLPTYPHYKCPVYKTSDRRYLRCHIRIVLNLVREVLLCYCYVIYRGILATTGHSSNFVCFVNMPSEVAEQHWVERGVAMLTQLDD